MKKSNLSLFAFAIMSGPVFATELDNNCGCGIGSMIFKEKNTLVAQVFAATTNASSGNQTFGISSGTLGCDQPIAFVLNERLNKFIAGNIDTLAKEMAMGEGESLDTLAELMRVAPDKRGEFYTLLQSNYANVFSATSVNHKDVLNRLVSIYETI